MPCRVNWRQRMRPAPGTWPGSRPYSFVTSIYVRGDRVEYEIERRRELGKFLATRRGKLSRDDLGVPPLAGRKTGLRREEAAARAGVSLTWYSWLEQGRDHQPSQNVLDAVSRALCLLAAEHAYLLSLAGYPPPRLIRD